MKYKICLIFGFLFSIITIGSFPLIDWSYSDFYVIEKEVKENTEFVESGVKVEYESNLIKGDILKSLEEILRDKYNLSNLIIKDDQIQLKTEDVTIVANVYENNKKTIVDVEMTNFSKEKKILNLMQELSQLLVNNSDKPRYFKYIKGRIFNEDNGLDLIKSIQKIKDIDTLEIHNGYVGTAKLHDGERVNFAVSNYDKGTYLVIGTPIIFSTY